MKRTLCLLLLSLISTFALAQSVKIGDILCVQGADTLVVHPENYTDGGIGVVFYVDETGQHGWVLHPQIQASYIYWSYDCVLPWGLTGWQSLREALYDLDGYENTGFLRSASQNYHDLYPGAWVVDYEHGWYWPAIGQLNLLYGSLPLVNPSLQRIGGSVIQGKWAYWSSSVYGFDNDCALYSDHKGTLGAIMKSRTELPSAPMEIRSIRNF